jgi:hypothetical protein
MDSNIPVARNEQRYTIMGGVKMQKYRLLFALFFIAMALSAGCENLKETVITGSGNVITLEEDLTGFEQVDVSNAFKVDIRQGDDFAVVIRVDDNITKHLEVAVKDNTLAIGLKPGRYDFRKATLEADVIMPQLLGVELSGASHVTVTGFKSAQDMGVDVSGASHLQGDIEADEARFDASGASSVTLEGSAGDVMVDASGGSEVILADFAAVDAKVNASGTSKVTVNASGKLDAEASGASTIRYLGNPTIERRETSGSSTIRGE